MPHPSRDGAIIIFRDQNMTETTDTSSPKPKRAKRTPITKPVKPNLVEKVVEPEPAPITYARNTCGRTVQLISGRLLPGMTGPVTSEELVSLSNYIAIV